MIQYPIAHTLEIDIIFVVNVPVLSLHITVVHPSVSTDVNVRTMAFSLAILLVPSAKHLDTKHNNNVLLITIIGESRTSLINC